MLKSNFDISTFDAFKQGDEKAFAIIFKIFSDDVIKKILYTIKDEELSVELMQQIFVKLWKNKESLGITYENFSFYINRMVASVCIDHLRKDIRTRNLLNNLSSTEHHYESSVEDIYLYKEGLSILEEAISLLPPQRKEIFTLCRLEGHSYTEVSEMLGISVSTVSNQLVSATKTIRNHASKYHLELKSIPLIFFLKNLFF